MRFTYDPGVDAASIAVGERGGPVTTQELDDGVNVDFDAAGRVVGIEVLAAKERLHFQGPLTVAVEEALPAEEPVPVI